MKTDPTQHFQGHLKGESPLRAIFPNGMIPLTTPMAQSVNAGGKAMKAYLLALSAVTPGQKNLMARRMADMGQGTYEEARADLDRDGELPIREEHFSGSSFPLRFV